MKAIRQITALLLAAVMAACMAGAVAESEENLLPVQSEGIDIPVFSEENMKTFDLPDNEAIRMAAKMKVGWNLGNQFDAYDDSNPNLGLELESWWSKSKTRQNLIHTLKVSGFNLIRIPVSWHNHVSGEDYTIDPEWMERVKTVAQWAADEGMYFIINVHHDNAKKYFYPDEKHAEQSEKYLTSIWTQIAEAFKDFDEHCILESLNEPRLVGMNNLEWWLDETGTLGRNAAKYINEWNQKFVDIVRASGGNNATRYLLVPGYCASPSGVDSKLFTVPEDTAENRIMIEVHAYTPYNFALNKNSTDSSFDLEKDKSKKNEISSFMDKLYNKFVSKGIPVIIDEFGAMQKKPEDLQARVNFAAYYVASASTRGITCCWWDNHCFTGDGERFGIIIRGTSRWKYPDIALAMLRNCMLNREQLAGE